MVRYVDEPSGMEELSRWLEGRKYLTLDLETGPAEKWIGTEHEAKGGLDPYLSQIVLILLGTQHDQWIIDARAGLDLSPIQKILEDPNVTVIGHNLRFDYKMVRAHYGWRPNRLVDSMIAEQVIRAGVFSADENVKPGFIRGLTSLASLVRFYFGVELDKDQELRTSFWKTPVGKLSQREIDYAVGDIVWPERLFRTQKKLINERGLAQTVRLEFELIPVLAEMELNGMILDEDKWLELYQKSMVELEKCDIELDKVFGIRSYLQQDLFGSSQIVRRVNYGSHVQLAKLLHSKGYPGFVDENGKPLSTEGKIIQIAQLNGDIPAEVAEPIRRRKKIQKRMQSYGLNFIQAIHPVTGRIHPDFTQNTLVTGRISCSPGLQTIPRDAEYRASFIAGDGYTFSIVDASQIEARIIADLTGDPLAIKVFQEDGDIYKHDGELIYNTTIDRSTKEGETLRNNAKAAWLGLGYGQGKKKFRLFMMVNLNRWVSQEESDYLYDRFFEIHAVMKEVMDSWSLTVDPENSDQYFDDELAERLIDRRKAWQSIYDNHLRFNRGDEAAALAKTRRVLAHPNRVRYSSAYGGRKRFFRADFLGWFNAGRNAPVQGGAAHIQKESMVELHNFIVENGYDAQLVNAVHDEIIVRVRDDQAEEFHEHHKRIMVEVGDRYLTKVPMKVAGGLSPVWCKF